MLKLLLLIFLCVGCEEKFKLNIDRNSVESLSHPECEAYENDSNYPECVKNNVVFSTYSGCGNTADYKSNGTYTYGKNINPDDCKVDYDISGSYTGVIHTDSSSCRLVNESYVCDYGLSLNEAPDDENFNGTLKISCPNSLISTFNISASGSIPLNWIPPSCAPPQPGGDLEEL